MDFDPQEYERIRQQKIVASHPPALDEVDEWAIRQGKAIGRLNALKPCRPWTELRYDPNWKDGR